MCDVVAEYMSYSHNNKLTSHLVITICYCTMIMRLVQVYWTNLSLRTDCDFYIQVGRIFVQLDNSPLAQVAVGDSTSRNVNTKYLRIFEDQKQDIGRPTDLAEFDNLNYVLRGKVALSRIDTSKTLPAHVTPSVSAKRESLRFEISRCDRR